MLDKIELSNNYDVEDFNEIKNRFIVRMKELNIDFQQKDEIAIDIMINALLNKDLDRNRYTYIINASCGMGKSVLIEVYTKYMLEKYEGDYGCIIAKELTEDLIRMQERDSNTYALYGFKPEDCLAGHTGYNPNICRDCAFEECRIKKNKEEVKLHPIIATTHDRVHIAESLNYVRDQLMDYFYEASNKEMVSGRRYDMFIDENPEFYELNYIQITDLDFFLDEIKTTLYKRNCKNKNKLYDYLRNAANEIKKVVGRERSYFDGLLTKSEFKEFTKYEELFYDNYYGYEFMKCLDVINVLKYGGKIVDGNIFFPVYHSLQKLPFNKIILDATGALNIVAPRNCKLINVPETRSFDNVTVWWCKNNNLSKKYYKEHPDMIEKLADYAVNNTNDHEKVFFVTFKKHKDKYQEIFTQQGVEDKFLMGHVNATKGKNEFNQATSAFIGYNLWKGSDYYLFGRQDVVDKIGVENITFSSHQQRVTAFQICDEVDENGIKKMKLID